MPTCHIFNGNSFNILKNLLSSILHTKNPQMWKHFYTCHYLECFNNKKKPSEIKFYLFFTVTESWHTTLKDDICHMGIGDVESKNILNVYIISFIEKYILNSYFCFFKVDFALSFGIYFSFAKWKTAKYLQVMVS